jgi:uncharacterized phage infection (PIP) family protein YhgE
VTVRSWDDAVAYAQDELAKAGDLEGRLEGYAETAARLSVQIDVVEQARPALDAIQKLRGVNVPLVGDGWQILLALLSLATVDGAKILARLEEVLRALAELKESLDNLNGLTDTADALRAFRNEPTPRTLAAAADASATATPALSRLQSDLSRVLKPLKDVAGNLSGLVKGLQGAADAHIPLVSDAARTAAERIGPIEGPLVDLRDGLEQLHLNIQADMKTLENIQEVTHRAQQLGD